MRQLLITGCTLVLSACGYNPNLGNTPEVSATPDVSPTPTATPIAFTEVFPTGTVTSTPAPTATPQATATITNMFRPCVIVEETDFNANTDKTIWKPSYYYTPKTDANVTFDEYGISLSGPRSGVTFFPAERDVSSCPSMAFRVRGAVHYQSLGGAGYDNREAPIAVMIQYTDTKGVKHSSLNAFNEGEPNDRNTTRMFWWGFGYLNPTTTFGFNNFTPSISPVTQSTSFDITIDLFEKLGRTVKIVNTITIEGSGWGLCSTVTGFAMKPNEAFIDPSAPYHLP